MALGAYIGTLILLLPVLAASFPVTPPQRLNKWDVAIENSSPSFIDTFEGFGPAISKNYNSGLGKESILYVDDDIIIVNKPTACSTAPGLRETESLATRIASTFRISRIDKMIVHRLDYATSGLVVFARNDDALSDLHSQFRLRKKVYKQYSAIVKGYLNYFEGEIDLPLGKEENCPPLCKVDSQGKDSFTTWTLFGRNKGKSHVHLRPHTGRWEKFFRWKLRKTPVYCIDMNMKALFDL